jgi:hypothetical protein
MTGSVLASIPSPPADGFHFGPLIFHAYGLAILAAVAITKLGLQLNLFVASVLFADGIAWFARIQCIRLRAAGTMLLITGVIGTAALTGCGHDGDGPPAVIR